MPKPKKKYKKKPRPKVQPRPGRPSVPVTKEMCDKAEKWAAEGCNYKEIGILLGLSPTTFIDKRREFPELEEAIERGVATAVKAVRRGLLINATARVAGKPGGDVAAQKYFLQTRAGDGLEAEGDGQGTTVVRIILPSNAR